MQAQLQFIENLQRQYDETKARLLNIKLELASYEKIMTLLKDHIDENVSVQKRLSTSMEDERRRAVLKESHDKLRAKYERFRLAKVEREDEYKNQLNTKNQLESNLNSMKTQTVQDKRNNQRQESVFDYDVETINFLNECNWNLGECGRALSESLLSCFPSGTFLVRQSKSHQNSYALSVVANSKVRHCLIEKTPGGFCFSPPSDQHPFYSTLLSLVMDYRDKSLHRHHPELNTNLVYPILSQLKKNNKQFYN